MQGKITKVLNMKPAEILGMVEEAAGTRMFEERKEKAVKTMAKKDKKVEEIESVSLRLGCGWVWVRFDRKESCWEILEVEVG